ncbi:WLM domain-containing protein [Scheffersomyces xylosifermentans]|uniref:WLM domain-containing protein n=1 Tax=Scheffersomyces xylosifermentans TaxID=1304137 RepID=UPI00315DD2A0
MVREAKGNNGKRKNTAKPPDRPSPVSNIQKIASLIRYPDKSYAADLLHQAAKMVAPIIHENNFKVGTLCEMFPKNANLLGLNVNRGQKILIRLRYHSNDKSFYPMGDIIGTLLHELTHNLYSAHDDKFYKFLDGLKKRFEEIQYGGASTTYRCEEEKLGGKYNPFGGYVSEREKRIKELSKPKYKSEVRKLGTALGPSDAVRSSPNNRISKVVYDPRRLRQLLLEAAERRMRDAKWCPSNVNIKDVEPSNDELEIIDIDGEESDYDSDDKTLKRQRQKKKIKQYKDVVDLTSEEYGDLSKDDIIVIDACDENNKNRVNKQSDYSLQPKSCLNLPKSILRHPSPDDSDDGHKDRRKVQFSSLLPSFDDEKKTQSKADEVMETEESIQYTFSSSPGRVFFGDEEQYPRRKLVAHLNFEQIMEKGDKIEVHSPVNKPKEKRRRNPSKTKKKKVPESTQASEKSPPSAASTKTKSVTTTSTSTITTTSKTGKRRTKRALPPKQEKKLVKTITFEELL